MQSKITVAQMKAVGRGYKPVSTQDIARINEHPGVAEWFSENWDDILVAIGAGVTSAFTANPGLAAVAIKSAESMASGVAKGSSSQKMAKSQLQFSKSTDYDQIRVVYRAWSEDDLKPDTCKVIHAPSESELGYSRQGQKSYSVLYVLDTSKLAPGTYPFIFGAQDNGWLYDVAVTNEFDLIFGG